MFYQWACPNVIIIFSHAFPSLRDARPRPQLL